MQSSRPTEGGAGSLSGWLLMQGSTCGRRRGRRKSGRRKREEEKEEEEWKKKEGGGEGGGEGEWKRKERSRGRKGTKERERMREDRLDEERERSIPGVGCDSGSGAHLVSFAPRYSWPINGVPYCTCWGGVCNQTHVH